MNVVFASAPERRWLLAVTWFVLTAIAGPPLHAANNPTDGWKYDVVHLKNGKPFCGLVIEESPAAVRMQCVQRKPGQPTFTVFTTFQRDEIARVDRLDTKDREILGARLKALDPVGKGEERRMEELELKPAPWGDQPTRGLQYSSEHFNLVSNAPEDVVRRAAVRLDDVYTAFTRYLPPNRPTGNPTTVVLVQSFEEYQTMLKARGWPLLNPALFDTNRNQILCASDLQRLGEDLKETRLKHQEYLAFIARRETEFRKLPKGEVRDKNLLEAATARQHIKQANERNEKVFDRATRRLFQTLYHEAFHAYLANFVYPPAEYEVPRWLNEGLAQIFESALVEAGELRVGHADPVRLERVRALAKANELFPLSDLLRAGPKQFLVNHAGDQQVSDRAYTTSWALAFYLTFERHLLGTPELDRYLRDLKRGADPAEAFRLLTGGPLPAFEQSLKQYVTGLQPDGTARR